MAIFVASDIFLQSINQNRAETVVVNETQSLTKVNGVEPVTSSHCALDGPPVCDIRNVYVRFEVIAFHAIVFFLMINHFIDCKTC